MKNLQIETIKNNMEIIEKLQQENEEVLNMDNLNIEECHDIALVINRIYKGIIRFGFFHYENSEEERDIQLMINNTIKEDLIYELENILDNMFNKVEYTINEDDDNDGYYISYYFDKKYNFRTVGELENYFQICYKEI